MLQIVMRTEMRNLCLVVYSDEMGMSGSHLLDFGLGEQTGSRGKFLIVWEKYLPVMIGILIHYQL